MKARACFAMLAATALAGCGGGEQVAEMTVPRRPIAAADTRIEGATAAQERLLRSILGDFGRTGIARIVLSEPPAQYGPHAASAQELTAYYADDSDNQSHWEGNLVAGAFNIRSGQAGIGSLAAFHDGAMGYEGRVGSAGEGASGGGPSLRDLEHDVSQTVENQAGQLVDLRAIELAGHPVVSATVQADDAAEFLVNRYPMIEAETRREGVAGNYIEILDSDGLQAQVTYGVSLGGIGLGSIGPRSDLEGCGPDHSRPAGTDPPPCPYRGPRPYVVPGTVPQLDVPKVLAAANVAGADVIDAGRGSDLKEMCGWVQIEACPHADDGAVVWVVSDGHRWAVVDDASRVVLGSG